MKEFSGVLQTGKYVLFRQARIIRKNLRVVPSGSEQIHNEFHRDSRTRDHRLADKDFWIDYDSVSQFHVPIINQPVDSGLQFRGDLRGDPARFFHLIRLKADRADARMSAAAVTLADRGQIVGRLNGRPGIRAH